MIQKFSGKESHFWSADFSKGLTLLQPNYIDIDYILV